MLLISTVFQSENNIAMNLFQKRLFSYQYLFYPVKFPLNYTNHLYSLIYKLITEFKWLI